jgi:hypothetical protein
MIVAAKHMLDLFLNTKIKLIAGLSPEKLNRWIYLFWVEF